MMGFWLGILVIVPLSYSACGVIGAAIGVACFIVGFVPGVFATAIKVTLPIMAWGAIAHELFGFFSSDLFGFSYASLLTPVVGSGLTCLTIGFANRALSAWFRRRDLRAPRPTGA